MGVTLFFREKIWRPFLVWWPFCSCRLLTTPIFPRCLSSVLSKFSHKKINFRSGVTPWRVSPGVVRPSPSDATAYKLLMPMHIASETDACLFCYFLALHVVGIGQLYWPPVCHRAPLWGICGDAVCVILGYWVLYCCHGSVCPNVCIVISFPTYKNSTYVLLSFISFCALFTETSIPTCCKLI